MTTAVAVAVAAANDANETPETIDLATMSESQKEQEVYSLMRATRRSRVQVLNAIKVRGPDRDAVLRALSSR
jgi:hypothetical protein